MVSGLCDSEPMVSLNLAPEGDRRRSLCTWTCRDKAHVLQVLETVHRHGVSSFFFFNDTATTEIYTLSLHDALPISLYLVEQEPNFLRQLEKQTGLELEVRDDPMMRLDEFRMMARPAGRDVTEQYAVA